MYSYMNAYISSSCVVRYIVPLEILPIAIRPLSCPRCNRLRKMRIVISIIDFRLWRMRLYTIDLQGKNALVFGVANQRSIAWHIAKALDAAGAGVTLSYFGERVRPGVERLGEQLSSSPTLIECDASDDASLARAFDQLREEVGSLHIVVHSIAFANLGAQRRPRRAVHRHPQRRIPPRARHQRILARLHRQTRRAAHVRRRQYNHYDIPSVQPCISRIQCDGNGKSRARKRSPPARMGSRAQRCPRKRHKRGAGRYAILPRHQRIPRYETRARRPLTYGAQHNAGRSSRRRALPVQRHVIGNHRRGDSCRYWIPCDGYIIIAARPAHDRLILPVACRANRTLYSLHRKVR